MGSHVYRHVCPLFQLGLSTDRFRTIQAESVVSPLFFGSARFGQREISDRTDPIRRIPSDPRQDKSKNIYYKNIAGLIVRGTHIQDITYFVQYAMLLFINIAYPS